MFRFKSSFQKAGRHLTLVVGLLIILALTVAACGSTAPTAAPIPTAEPTMTAESAIIPSVAVADQSIEGGTVTVARVVSEGPGWIVIHAQAEGKPGPILGYAPVADGENNDVVVEIDPTQATETLYAMLHTDAGEVGTWEFPNGPDAPVKVEGKVVTPSFSVTGGLPAAEEGVTPSVTVADQSIEGGTVTVAQVVSKGPGWIVIHAQAEGKPGPILGYAPVTDGENNDVVVEIDPTQATETLYAMLHTDAGEMGKFEFPDGPDGPVKVDGKVVTPPFRVSMAQGTLVKVAQGSLGSFLVDANGMTLYIFLNDEPGKSNCYDACAQNWPPLLTEGAPVAGEGVDAALLGTAERSDGTMQVTYNGWPLYYFVNDAAPGDTNGQGLKDVWYVVSPDLDVAEGEAEVVMKDFQFHPAVLLVKAGTTVTWVHKDGSVQHNVESDDGLWESELFTEGGTFSYTFDEPGVYPYHCHPHGGEGGQGMAGTIIVLP